MRRGRDVNHIGARGSEHLLHIIKYLWHFEPGRRLNGQIALAVAYGHSFRLRQFADLAQMGVGDLSAADQGHAKFARCH